MIDPSVWGNLPFRNRTAWTDFVGQHWLWHRALGEHVTRTLGASYRIYPIGDGGGSLWLHAVQNTYNNASAVLELPPPADLSGYDLSQEDDFASWTFLVSQTALGLRAAAAFN